MKPTLTHNQSVRTELSREVIQLREQLKRLIDRANDSQALSHRVQQFELRLLSAPGVTEMIALLLKDFVAEFNLLSATLILQDSEYEIAHILDHANAGELQRQGLVLVANEKPIANLFPDGLKPRFCAGDDPEVAALIPVENQARFLLVLPLSRRQRLLGALVLANRAGSRFEENANTDLLERLMSILAVAHETNLNLERLKQAGLIDALTAVNNRRFFEQRLVEEVERATRKADSLVCLMIDVDHFKAVNDEHGHQAGDEVLKQIAGHLSQMMRRTDVLARYGGEEFVALLPDTDAEVAREVAERIRHKVEQSPIRISDALSLRKTISIGLAVYRTGGAEKDDADALIARADKALYLAKQAGRNRVLLIP